MTVCQPKQPIQILSSGSTRFSSDGAPWGAVESLERSRAGCAMRADGTFSVRSFTPAPVTPAIDISTAVDVGVATMEKVYEGAITGRSSTLFTAAFDQAAGVGTYVAMESFEGTIDGAAGTCNFAHAATTGGSDRRDELFVIVPSSGTGALTGIRGSGGMTIDDDGTHRIWFSYEL